MYKNLSNLYEYTQFRGRDGNHKYKSLHGKESSVTATTIRKDEADKQKSLAIRQHKTKNESVANVIKLTEEFLAKIEFEVVYYNDNPIIELDKKKINQRNKVVRINYDDVAKQCSLNNRNHIIWMKFTEDGYLGLVAASDDINFSMKNSSGSIINYLTQKWDESFVLMFPLKGITDGLRKDIECGIGNYLIDNNVPILDFYSHRFQ